MDAGGLQGALGPLFLLVSHQANRLIQKFQKIDI